MKENLAFRRHLWHLGNRSEEDAQSIYCACSRSLLFFVNTFCWLNEPRPEGDAPAILPFISYPFQDEVFKSLYDNLGKNDVFIEKSRDMGVTWMILTAMFHRWLFREYNSFLVVSRKQDMVDNSENPDTLFYKIRFLLKWLPSWLSPSNVNQKSMHLANMDNGSVFDGESTTENIGVGGRRTALFVDEFARFEADLGYEVLTVTRDLTKSRIFASTPKGTGNAFYTLHCKPENEIIKLRLHWSKHPKKAAGLYKDSSGKERSPWYDNECIRAVSSVEIARELDIDYQGSGGAFFSPISEIDRLTKEAKNPVLEGDLEEDPTTGRFRDFIIRHGGALKLWRHPEAFQKEEFGPYVVGIDIAAGTGASNSCISVFDAKTKEKVAEYVRPDIVPEKLATKATALCWWFSDRSKYPAKMIWEASGIGRIFGIKILDIGFSNIYFKRNERTLARKLSDEPGFYTSGDSKKTLLGEYRSKLFGNYVKVYSLESLNECRCYYYTANDRIEHTGAQGLDPSGAKSNHGDRVIADALCVWLMKETSIDETKEQEQEIPENCFAARRMRFLRERQTEEAF